MDKDVNEHNFYRVTLVCFQTKFRGGETQIYRKIDFGHFDEQNDKVIVCRLSFKNVHVILIRNVNISNKCKQSFIWKKNNNNQNNRIYTINVLYHLLCKSTESRTSPLESPFVRGSGIFLIHSEIPGCSVTSIVV